MIATEAIFGRVIELDALRERLRKRNAFLLYGPAGVGKTLLLQQVAAEFPEVLYSAESFSPQSMFRNLAAALPAAGDEVFRRACGPRPAEALARKSAAAIKGMVLEALRRRGYWIVLDHLRFTSQAFAGALRDVMVGASTPVLAVARSCHMEDAGFVLSLFPDRAQRFEMRNFAPEVAGDFARRSLQAAGVNARNLPDFERRLAELSGGNPGAMLAMIELAANPKYRSGDNLKITPLYVDFRLEWNAR